MAAVYSSKHDTWKIMDFGMTTFGPSKDQPFQIETNIDVSEYSPN
jgi:hypothetical protein